MPFWNFMHATGHTGCHDFPSTPDRTKEVRLCQTLKNRFLQGRLTRREFRSLGRRSPLPFSAPAIPSSFLNRGSLTQKNPNYWKDDRGHFDEVEILGIADVNARINALRTGVIDVMNECSI